MKAGVLEFSYAGFAKSFAKVEAHSFYTTNLGDNAQTIAARQLLERLHIASSDIVGVDRDSLPAYAGEPVALVMNGVFYDHNFPVPPAITPIFVGFCTKSEALVHRYRDWFKRFEPIGCRDTATAHLMEAAGIAAIVTGCITMTLPTRPRPPRKPRLLVVYGAGTGLLPPQVLKHVPPELMDRAEFIHHRLPANEIPLSAASRAWIERYEAHLIGRYRDEAQLVLTPLLHVASPCLGMGVPVVLCRKDRDSRFGFLETMTRLYTPDAVAEIDWNPAPVDISAPVAFLIGQLRKRLAGALHGH